MELTDLDICTRIAEIEGEKIVSPIGDVLMVEFCDGKLVNIPATQYNPLTDKALCFELMVKYEVNIDFYTGVASIDSDYTNKPPAASQSFDAECLTRAICLAIIEAKANEH